MPGGTQCPLSMIMFPQFRKPQQSKHFQHMRRGLWHLPVFALPLGIALLRDHPRGKRSLRCHSSHYQPPPLRIDRQDSGNMPEKLQKSLIILFYIVYQEEKKKCGWLRGPDQRTDRCVRTPQPPPEITYRESAHRPVRRSPCG